MSDKTGTLASELEMELIKTPTRSWLFPPKCPRTTLHWKPLRWEGRLPVKRQLPVFGLKPAPKGSHGQTSTVDHVRCPRCCLLTPSATPTYAHVPHLLGDLDFHVPTVPLLPSPLVILGCDVVVIHRLKALIQGRDGSRGHRWGGCVGFRTCGAWCGSCWGLSRFRHFIMGALINRGVWRGDRGKGHP